MSTKRLHKPLVTILDGAGETGAGTTINVSEYRHVVLEVSLFNSANLTVQFQGSASDDAPDFDSSQSETNHWDYVQVKDLQDAQAINGDTGVSSAGSDDFRLVEVNVNGLEWLNAEVSAYTAGNVTVKAKRFTNG